MFLRGVIFTTRKKKIFEKKNVPTNRPCLEGLSPHKTGFSFSFFFLPNGLQINVSCWLNVLVFQLTRTISAFLQTSKNMTFYILHFTLYMYKLDMIPPKYIVCKCEDFIIKYFNGTFCIHLYISIQIFLHKDICLRIFKHLSIVIANQYIHDIEMVIIV